MSGMRVPGGGAAAHLPCLHRLPRLQEAAVHREEQPGVPGLHLGRRLLLMGHRDKRHEGGRGQDDARVRGHCLPRHLRRLHVCQVCGSAMPMICTNDGVSNMWILF